MSKELLGEGYSNKSRFSVSQTAYSFIKRAADVFFSVVLLLLLSPVLLLVCGIITLTSRGPVIFRQERVGKNSRVFRVFKFRTMHITAPSNVATQDLCNADEHLTGIGKLLRKTSIDELPQLLNVFLGQMSFVGPRPLIVAEAEMHSKRAECGVYTVRPGITGLAQVNGRDTVSDEQKLEFDCLYLEKFGLFQDLHILFKSIRVVLARQDIVEGTAAEEPSSEPVMELERETASAVCSPVFERKKVG